MHMFDYMAHRNDIEHTTFLSHDFQTTLIHIEPTLECVVYNFRIRINTSYIPSDRPRYVEKGAVAKANIEKAPKLRASWQMAGFMFNCRTLRWQQKSK